MRIRFERVEDAAAFASMAVAMAEVHRDDDEAARAESLETLASTVWKAPACRPSYPAEVTVLDALRDAALDTLDNLESNGPFDDPDDYQPGGATILDT